MSGDGQSETCCPDLWDRINELEAELDMAANEIHRLGMKCSDHEDAAIKAQREWVSVEPLTGAGQIDEGDGLIFQTEEKLIVCTAKVLVFKGSPNEEVVYDLFENHYFITNMALNGKSHAKRVLVVKPLPPAPEVN